MACLTMRLPFGWPLLLLTVALCSCAGVLSPMPTTQQVLLHCSPDEAWQRASVALAHMGADHTVANYQARTLSGTLYNAVILNVAVVSTNQQSRVEVTRSRMADKVLFGSGDEGHRYLALLGDCHAAGT